MCAALSVLPPSQNVKIILLDSDPGSEGSGMNTSMMQERRLEEQSRTMAATSILVCGRDSLKNIAAERLAMAMAMRQRQRMRRVPLRPPCGASWRSWRGDDVVTSQGSNSRGRKEPAATFNWDQ